MRDWLKLQLLQGKRVLPMGEKCEGWSDITGCPGHPRNPDYNAASQDGFGYYQVNQRRGRRVSAADALEEVLYRINLLDTHTP